MPSQLLIIYQIDTKLYNKTMKKLFLTFLFSTGVLLCYSQNADENAAEGQSHKSMAMDATATQWSYQFAYQAMPDYHKDIVNGATRPAGLDNYLQLRIVAPIPLKKLTILSRLTVRHYENVNTGKSGFGNTELFALMIPKATDWGTGRAGIGTLVTAPGNGDVSKVEWG